MGRPKRAADGGLVYHVLNRANARMTIFKDDGDYGAFEGVVQEADERTETRLLACCRTTGALSCGRGKTASCLGLPVG